MNKKIKAEVLDDLLSDGATIRSILSDGNCDALFVEEWKETYYLDDDKKINRDMNSYRHALYREESRKAMKNSL